ncbi:MAG TPA: aryldialkylphosphatase [Candidatus Dormibacteraeota bacterium]|nr:aryldialkylphosphatase [Candidatus Dormibacteraeota bacterium]
MPDQIVTVLGPIAPEELGTTLSHEHLLFDLRALWEQPPPERAWIADTEPTLENRAEIVRDLYYSRPTLFLDDPAIAIEEASRFRDAGGSSIVDLTTIGLVPDPEALVSISEATGLNVVAGAGYYRAKTLPADDLDLSVEALADQLEGWVREGMDGTDVRAGLLGELGTASPIHPFEERQLRAAALVQRSTGVAINVHPQLHEHEHLHILDILEDAGADLGKVALSHCDQLIEPDWHARIAERGVFLSFDTFGAEFTYESDGSREPLDVERIDCLRRLLDAGRAAQLLVSHDICSRLQLHRLGGVGYDHILRIVVPALRDAGAAAPDIDRMLVDNPRRFLAKPA